MQSTKDFVAEFSWEILLSFDRSFLNFDEADEGIPYQIFPEDCTVDEEEEEEEEEEEDEEEEG